VKRKGTDGKTVQQKISWEEWQALVPSDVSGDPVKMRAWLLQSGIEGISYYHPSDHKGGESKAHGKAGADEARGLGVEVDPTVLVAIENHEVAYQFNKPKAETYLKYFGPMNSDARDMALTASYIDTAASLGRDGNPELSNFIALTSSKHNAELLTGAESVLPSADGLDPDKVSKLFTELRKADYRFPEASVEQLLDRIKRECLPTEYNIEKLEKSLQEYVVEGNITDAEKKGVLEMVNNRNAKQIGKIYGAKMKFISLALRAAEKK